jgi:circadian clock protein KaiC
MHLIEGAPGTGKTTLALQFLLDGVRKGEPVLYVTLSETADELHAVAASHGWSLDGVVVREMVPTEESLKPEEQYTVFHPSEVELGETTTAVLQEVDQSKPARVVFDSLAELQLLARDPLRYRRQILGLKQFFAGRRTTVLFLDSVNPQGIGLQSIAHSVLQLQQLAQEYGAERRRLRLMKMRGARYRGGYHDFAIETGSLRVFPRLVAAEHNPGFHRGIVSSGIDRLDNLLGGGLGRGTSALLIGPAGVGKSVLATQYAAAAVGRNESVAMYLFDESLHVFLDRADSLDLPVRKAVKAGRVHLRQLDPAQLSPGEFDQLVRTAVEEHGARLIIIDSINGYLNAMAEERSVVVQLHELLSYLNHHGVLTIMTLAQHGLVGDRADPPLDISYLADTVILLRYFEAAGELRKAMSVVKKRSGGHELSIRELRLGPGVRVGEPLREFQGVLAGWPRYAGAEGRLLDGGGSE